jgi:hypothetical protein
MSDRLHQLSSSEIKEIRDIFPNIPEEYFEVMKNRGWGKVSNNLMIYSGPVTPSEIYGDDYQDIIDKVIIFGDDFNGRCFGWDTNNNYSIVEIDPVDFSIEEVNLNFKEFIFSTLIPEP